MIDGYTQPGSAPNTNPIDQADNARIRIEIDGSQAGRPADGLELYAQGCTVRGLAIHSFITKLQVGTTTNLLLDGVGIFVLGDHETITGNFIGTDASGMVAHGNEVQGIALFGFDNTIGGTDPADRNLISANGAAGVGIASSETGNQIIGNFIGTNATGAAALPTNLLTVAGYRLASEGLLLEGSGNTAAARRPPKRNVISGNAGDGVGLLRASGTDTRSSAAAETVIGNYIGTDLTGTQAVPNGGDGVYVITGIGNFIGGTAPGQANIIAGNNNWGVEIQENNNTVAGNNVGTDATGLLPARQRSRWHEDRLIQQYGHEQPRGRQQRAGNPHDLDQHQLPRTTSSAKTPPVTRWATSETASGSSSRPERPPARRAVQYAHREHDRLQSGRRRDDHRDRFERRRRHGQSGDRQLDLRQHGPGHRPRRGRRDRQRPGLADAFRRKPPSELPGAHLGRQLRRLHDDPGDDRRAGESHLPDRSLYQHLPGPDRVRPGPDLAGHGDRHDRRDRQRHVHRDVSHGPGRTVHHRHRLHAQRSLVFRQRHVGILAGPPGDRRNAHAAADSLGRSLARGPGAHRRAAGRPVPLLRVHGHEHRPGRRARGRLPGDDPHAAGRPCSSTRRDRDRDRRRPVDQRRRDHREPRHAGARRLANDHDLALAAVAGALGLPGSVSAIESDPNTANNTTTLSPSIADGVVGTDLAVNVTAPAGPYRVGDEIHYTVDMINNGPLVATNVVLKETLPAGAQYIAADSSPGLFFNAGTNSVSINAGTLAPGDDLHAFIAARFAAAGPAIDTATVTMDQADTVAGNNTVSLTTTVLTGPSVTVLLGPAAPTNANDDAAFTVSVSTPSAVVPPSGTVTLAEGSQMLGQGQIDASGNVTFHVHSPRATTRCSPPIRETRT